MKLTCIIVEDEIKAKDVLERYINRVDYLSLISYCQDGLEALKIIPTEKPDIVFLDINMPILSGIELLEIIKDVPNVVITTAYSEYAIDSYNFEVVDYLLKPIEFSKFMRAISRVEKKINSAHKSKKQIEDSLKQDEFALFKSGSKTHKVYFNDILFLEKDGNYLEVNLDDGKKILVRTNMSDVFNLVPNQIFQRIHKSFVVNLNKIKTIEVNKLTLVNSIKIPLGAKYRAELTKKIKPL